MQPGHEEVLLAPEELSSTPEEFSSAPELEVLPAELLDDSNTSAQEMTVRLKRDMRIICKILFISFYSTVMRENKFEK
jgi:hypothetical protein